jgi:hypothetical protein
MISLGRGTRACGNPGSFPGHAPVLLPGSSYLLGEPHVHLIGLLATNFDVKWVMSQVGHADSKMTMDVDAQLEQRAVAGNTLATVASSDASRAAVEACEMEDLNAAKRTYARGARFRSMWRQLREGSSPLIRINVMCQDIPDTCVGTSRTL